MNTTLQDPAKIKRAKLLIYTLSAVIPIVVAVLFEVKIEGVDLSVLPSIYATINGITAFLLILALAAIKKGKRDLHRSLINICMALSLLFLALYVAYHMTSDSTSYGGNYKMVYYPLLISHIVLSVAVVPLVLFSYLQAWQGKFELHKKWVRISYPIWLFVAISGVVVYLMISPYYV